MPIEREIEHGVSLLREASNEAKWEGRVTAIPIDEVCKWDDGAGPCNKPVRNVVVLPYEDLKGCHGIAVCDHHTQCLEQSITRWRELN